MSMTESEAIEKIKKDICRGNPHGMCKDSCMLGKGICAYEMAITALEEIQKYRAIGTVSEFRELKEKATAKKVRGISLTHEGRVGNCPSCGKFIRHQEQRLYCVCGTALDWSEGKE